MEFFAIGLFCSVLVGFITMGWPSIAALLIGLVIFLAYGLSRGHGIRALAEMSWKGIVTAKSVINTMFLIGVLTALWRAGGTIPFIISVASGWMRAESMPLASFLLCTVVSVLIGTSFGTAATMGAICMAMALSCGASTFWTGGAVLAGAFFGDRCSPVSSSALLVSELTGTEIYANIRAMVRSAAIPFALSCAAYFAAGSLGEVQPASAETADIFAREFSLSPWCALPALLVIALATCRVKMRRVIVASSLAAFAIGIAVEGRDAASLARAAVLGFSASDPTVAAMMDGGGAISMMSVVVILLISSCYAGIFDGTGMLTRVKHGIARLGRIITPFGAELAASLAADAITCNQTLAIMLAHTLCSEGKEPPRQALDLSDTAVITAPLVPWSIAAIVPLTSAGAELSSIPAAVFLWLLPLCRLLHSARFEDPGGCAPPKDLSVSSRRVA